MEDFTGGSTHNQPSRRQSAIDPAFDGVLPRGMPVAQCYPVPREVMTLSCEAMSAERVAAYETVATKIMAGPGVYRKGYRSKRVS